MIQVRWLISQAEELDPFTGQWIDHEFAGPGAGQPPGNPRINWNWQPTESILGNFSVQWHQPTNRFAIWYELRVFEQPNDRVWQGKRPNQVFLRWAPEPSSPAPIPILGTVDPINPIGDALVRYRYGTYPRLPPDFCIGVTP